MSTTVPTTLTLEVIADRRRTIAFPELTTTHQVPLIGLKANRAFDVTAVLTNDQGQVLRVPVPGIVNGPLAANFPQIEVLVLDPQRMEPGYRLINLRTPDDVIDWLVLLDADQEPVWVFEGPPAFRDVRLSDTNTLFGNAFRTAAEMDWMGTFLSVADNPEIPSLHHEAIPLPDGRTLALSFAGSTVVPQYPTDEANPTENLAQAVIREEAVVFLDAQGALETSWPLSQVLDTTRIG